MVYGIAAGDLAKWLRVVEKNNVPNATQREIPPLFADYLLTLKCVSRAANGSLVITDKGRLALRMESPTALHRQEDPDELPPADPTDAAKGEDAERPTGQRPLREDE